MALLAALFAAVIFATYGPNAQAATPTKGEFQLDLIVSYPAGRPVEQVVSSIRSSGNFDVFFNITYVSNIGSSGLDGVRASSFNVDSFFDITYELTRSDFETEMVAMTLSGTLSDPSNPSVLIDDVKKALGTDGRVFYGHVTVLK